MPATITPNPATGGLFSVAREVPASEVNWTGERGWQLYSACPEGAVWCCEDSTAVPAISKRVPPNGQTLQFHPFTVYQITGCASGASRLPSVMDHNDKLSMDWLETNVEGWVSAALEIGACDSPGLFTLPNLTPPTPTGLDQAIARLIENRQRDGLFDRPVIHIPSFALMALCDCYDQLLLVADVAIGPGYGIISPTDQVPNGGWAYITGPVEYSLGARRLPPPDSMKERRLNYDDSLTERVAAYRFDPCGSYRIQFTSC